MGYSTNYSGSLAFTRDLTGKEVAITESIIDELELDLIVNDEYTGLEWAGNEKTYIDSDSINELVSKTKEQIDGFGLTGGFDCNGEEAGDIWKIKIKEDGIAVDLKAKIVFE